MRVLIFSFILLLFSVSALHAQESKLIEQGEWGSAPYQSMVELGGYYYIITQANKIDVINSSLDGSDSLVATIEPDLGILGTTANYELGKFKDKLVLQQPDKIEIYSISNASELTLEYTHEISTYTYFKPYFQNDKLFFFDLTGKVQILEENDSGYTVSSSSEPIDFSDAYGERFYIDERSYYFLNEEKVDQTYITNLYKYDTDTHQLIVAMSHENSSYSKFYHIGSERFIAVSDDRWSLISTKSNEIEILSNFDDEVFNGYHQFVTENDVLYALPLDKSYPNFYAYSISSSNEVSLLSTQSILSFLPESVYVGNLTEFTYNDGKLLGLSDELGVFEIELTNSVISSFNLLYNQSGRMGNVAIVEDKLYAPRRSRIDVVDISNNNDYVSDSSITFSADNIFNHDNKLLSTSSRFFSFHTLLNNGESEVEGQTFIPYRSIYQILKSDTHLFTIDYDSNGWYLYRYNLNSVSDLDEEPIKIMVPDSASFCIPRMIFIKNKLAFVEECSKVIVLFSDYDNENFAYDKTIENSYSNSHFSAKDDYFYFNQGFTFDVIKLNNSDELEKITSINVPSTPIEDSWSTYSLANKLVVVGDYLLAPDKNYIHLFNLKEPENPSFISSTRVETNIPLQGIISNAQQDEFQQVGDYITYNSDYGGILKLFKINHAPKANVDTMLLDEDGSIDLSTSYVDPENDGISFSVVEPPVHGSINTDSGKLMYSPIQNYNGSDESKIKVEDEHGNFVEHQLQLIISPINDAPTIVTEDLLLDEDTTLISDIIAEDVDGDDILFALVTEAEFGTATVLENGQLTYHPNSNFFGADSITLSVTDPSQATTTSELSIIVSPVNDNPIVVTTSFEVKEDEVLTHVISAKDVEAHNISFSLVEGTAQNGMVSLEENGNFVLTPVANFNGQAKFSVMATDSEQGSTEQEIIVDVEAVQDAPVAESSSESVAFSGSHSGSLTATDADGDVLTFTVVEDVKNGTLSLSLDGTYTYQANPSFVGTDSFVYQVADIQDNIAQATISLNVQATPPEKKSSSGGGSMNYILFWLLVSVATYRRLKLNLV